MRRLLTASLALLLVLVVSSGALAAGPFFGSVNSNVYHYPTCGQASRIKPDNEIWFSDEDEAVAKGYRPCNYCNPPLGEGTVKPDPPKSSSASSLASTPVRTTPTQPKAPESPIPTVAAKTLQAKSDPATEEHSDNDSGWYPFVSGFLVLIIIISSHIHRFEEKDHKSQYQALARDLHETRSALNEALEQNRRKDNQIAALQKQLSEMEEAMPPVPAPARSELWQDCEHPYGELTVYVSYKGQRFHRDLTCRGLPYGGKPVPIQDVPDWVPPCPYCARGYVRPSKPSVNEPKRLPGLTGKDYVK